MSLVECPGCLTKLRVPDSSATVRFNCPRCGEHLEVEGATTASPPKRTPDNASHRAAESSPERTRQDSRFESRSRSTRPAQRETRPSAAPRRRHESQSGKGFSIGLGICGVGLLSFVAGWLAVKTIGSNEKADEQLAATELPNSSLVTPVSPSEPGFQPLPAQTSAEQLPPDPSLTTGAIVSAFTSGEPTSAEQTKPSIPGKPTESSGLPIVESSGKSKLPGAQPPLMEERRPEDAKPSEPKQTSPPNWDRNNPETAVAGDGPKGADWASEGVIPFRRGGAITVGPPGCPVIVSGNQVWHKESQKLLAEFQGEFEKRGLAALSPDGKFFAAAMKSPNQEDTDVGVWNTETGEQLFVAKGETENYADTIVLSNNRLFIGGRSGTTLRVWDCAKGEELSPITFEDTKFDRGSVALSHDGEFISLVAEDRLIVAKTATGRKAAVMENPGVMPNESRGESIVIRDNKIVSSRDGFGDAVFVFAWLQSLAFSPDMEELAGVSTHPSPRVMCWNNRGRLVFDRPLYTQRRAFWENTLQWFPDRTAWLIESEIFHRETGRIVLSVRGRFGSDLQLFVYDNDHLMGTFPDSPDDLKVRRIPWEQIRESLAAMKEGRDALLAPGTPVRIDIQLGNTGGEQNSTATMIKEAIARRMARDEIPLANDAKAVFRVRFAESAGDTLPIYERQSLFDFRGKDTGRTMTEVQGSMVVELLLSGSDEPVWREALNAVSQRSFSEPITEETVRASMLSMLQSEIDDLNFPYFIPTSDKLLALPVVIE